MEPLLANSFLSRSREELHALLAQRNSPDFDPTDAYRALVLLGRLAQNTHGPSGRASPEGDRLSIEQCVELGMQMRALCRLPEVGELLAALQRELHSDSHPPSGPLHDALLDVDDLVTVSELLGDQQDAANAVRLAIELLRTAPQRTLALVAWAHMRIQACQSPSRVRTLWQALIVGAKGRQPLLRGTSIPLQLQHTLALAAADQNSDFPTQDIEHSLPGRIYLDQTSQELMLDIELPSDMPDESCHPVLRVSTTASDGQQGILFHAPLRHERDGRDLYISLGQLSGPSSLLRRAVEAIPPSLDRALVRFEVWFEDEA